MFEVPIISGEDGPIRGEVGPPDISGESAVWAEGDSDDLPCRSGSWEGDGVRDCVLRCDAPISVNEEGRGVACDDDCGCDCDCAVDEDSKGDAADGKFCALFALALVVG
jgi:hypothetical protein